MDVEVRLVDNSKVKQFILPIFLFFNFNRARACLPKEGSKVALLFLKRIPSFPANFPGIRLTNTKPVTIV